MHEIAPYLRSELCIQRHEPPLVPGLQGFIYEAVSVGAKELHPAMLPCHANPSSVTVPEQEEIVSMCAFASHPTACSQGAREQRLYDG